VGFRTLDPGTGGRQDRRKFSRSFGYIAVVSGATTVRLNRLDVARVGRNRHPAQTLDGSE